MFPYYNKLPPNFVLPEDDSRGILQIYGLILFLKDKKKLMSSSFLKKIYFEIFKFINLKIDAVILFT